MPTTQPIGEDGYLRIRVNTASGALTVPGASVVITERTRDDELGSVLYHAVTDESGLTPKFSLAAPPAYLSNSPEGDAPYFEYQVRIQKPSFFPMIYEGIPIFEKVTTEQAVELVPTPEGIINPTPHIFPAYSGKE